MSLSRFDAIAQLSSIELVSASTRFTVRAIAQHNIISHVPAADVTIFRTTKYCTQILFNAVTHFLSLLINSGNSIENQFSGLLSFCSLMFSQLPYNVLINEALKLGRYNVKVVEVTEMEDLLKHFMIADQHIRHKFSTLCSVTQEFYDVDDPLVIAKNTACSFSKLTSLTYHHKYSMAMISVYVLLMFKQLTNENHQQWMENLWKSFCGAGGLLEVTAFGLDSSCFPDANICKSIYRIASNHFEIRKIVFQMIMGSAAAGRGEIWSPFCTTILELCSGAEMDHIYLINEYILQKHPALCDHPLLSHEANIFFKAMNILRTPTFANTPKEYLMILHKKETLSEFNRNLYPQLIYLAKTIGSFHQPSLANYRSSLDSGNPKLKSVLDSIASDALDKLLTGGKNKPASATAQGSTAGNGRRHVLEEETVIVQARKTTRRQ